MQVSKRATLFVLGCTLAGAAAAEGFKPYPNATRYTPPDTEATETFTSNVRPGTTISAYLTHDSLEKVVAFYKESGTEYSTPAMHAIKLPNGQQVKKVFLIFDGARNLVQSKQWISIQRPFVGTVSVREGKPQYADVRDMTEIVLTEKKDVAKSPENPVEKVQ
jgi:hypothetical protein